MNWKIIVIGGIAFFVITLILSMITGPLLHDGILVDDYMATASFWRPELMQQPPDMAALLPRWIVSGLICSFIIAGIYSVVRDSFAGSGWVRGAKYGVVVALFGLTFMLGWSGVFNLPDGIWAWWWVESLVMNVVAGAGLGWIVARLTRAPAPAAAATA
jgi:hypothetical protein